MTLPELSGRVSHRPPLPFDWRAFDFGFIGSQRVGHDGDPDNNDRFRLRSRSGHLIRVHGSNVSGIEVEYGTDVGLPDGFPRINEHGLLLHDSDDEYATLDWPWDAERMLSQDHGGFTVLVQFREHSTLLQGGRRVLFALGHAGIWTNSQPHFDISKDQDIYRSSIYTTGSNARTSDSAYADDAIEQNDEVVCLAGVRRGSTTLQSFIDLWVNGTRVGSSEFTSSNVTATAPDDWDDDVAALNARTQGQERGINFFRRISFDVGIWTGPEGLNHFGVDLL